MRLAPPALARTLALALAACAHDVTARFPSTPGQATGRVALVFTDVADSVTVAIDGVLVVQDARTEHVVITGVPTGYADLSVAVGPTEKTVRVWIEADRETAVPLGAIGEAPLSAVRSLAISLASVALYALLR